MQIINLNRKWQIGDQLGQGGFGKVFLAQSENNVAAVVKLIPKDPGADRELLFDNLEGMPYVVPILDSGESEEHYFLVMPKADMSLRDLLLKSNGRLSISDAVEVLVDVSQALVAIENRVVHRDIKPENILLLDGHWNLADFGISKYAEATTAPNTHKYAMTYAYAAPERWRAERATSATDVYSLGVVAYELLAGEKPFLGPTDYDFRRQHLEEEARPIHGIPMKLQSTIDQCLFKEQQARPSAQNVLAQLRQGQEPSSEAVRRLQQANQQVVQLQAKEQLQRSKERSEEERRIRLYDASKKALLNVLDRLSVEIFSNAPASIDSGEQGQRSWSLNEARLVVEPVEMAETQDAKGSIDIPFEVVACSSISVTQPTDWYGYDGRSHSLWYCDAQEKGVFKWYETAFSYSPLRPRRVSTCPFALNPGPETSGALSRGVHEYVVAWPFTAVTQGNEESFTDRWIDWFAQAVQRELRRPRHMPERDPGGSWRR